MSSNPDFNRTLPAVRPESAMEINDQPSSGYALSGKIMLSAILILFAVVVFMICLHLYARWFLLRERRRHLHRRNRRRSHLVFYVEPDNPNSATVAASAAARGLDASVLNSLPVFVFSSKTHPSALECAVCLSEFEENEKSRLLPKCNHCFHTECIDMWFHSHSTCPLCRSPVEPVPENRSDVVVLVGEPGEEETSSNSGLCAACQHEEDDSMASSSAAAVAALGDRRKGFEMASVTIEVPRRNESGDEFGPSAPASLGFKSPASRLLSLKRILSMKRRGAAVSPSSGMTSRGCASSELDIEYGRNEATQ